MGAKVRVPVRIGLMLSARRPDGEIAAERIMRWTRRAWSAPDGVNEARNVVNVRFARVGAIVSAAESPWKVANRSEPFGERDAENTISLPRKALSNPAGVMEPVRAWLVRRVNDGEKPSAAEIRVLVFITRRGAKVNPPANACMKMRNSASVPLGVITPASPCVVRRMRVGAKVIAAAKWKEVANLNVAAGVMDPTKSITLRTTEFSTPDEGRAADKKCVVRRVSAPATFNAEEIGCVV